MQVRAAAGDGAVQVPREGVVDDADQGPVFGDEGERDGGVGVAVHEVEGAVDGVDDEGGVRGQPGAVAGDVAFFAQELVVWVGGGEGGGEHVFDCVVGFRHEVGRVGFGREGAGEGRGRGEHVAGGLGEGDEELVDVVEVGVEHCGRGGGEGGVGAVGEVGVEVGVISVAHFDDVGNGVGDGGGRS